MHRRSLVAALLLCSCGGRSSLFGDSTDASPDAAVDAAALPHLDAAAPSAPVDAMADAGLAVEAEAEAEPARPCHLVPSGEAVPSIVFTQTGYRFKQEGM